MRHERIKKGVQLVPYLKHCAFSFCLSSSCGLVLIALAAYLPRLPKLPIRVKLHIIAKYVKQNNNKKYSAYVLYVKRRIISWLAFSGKYPWHSDFQHPSGP